MNEQQQKHERIKRILKIVGAVVAVCGLVLAIIGLADFFSSFGSSEPPTLFWCAFIGLPMFAIGIVLMLFGFRKEIARYVKNESTPIFNEAAREIRPGVSDMASAVRQGLAEGVPCPRCGAANDRDAKFCKECGAPLHRTCPSCGNEVSADAKFCDNCGKPL